MKIEAHGLRAELPSGWEGRISRRQPGSMTGRRGAAANGADAGTNATASSGAVLAEDTGPILHMANFALPEERGDFGSGAVDLMGQGHMLVVLVEYGSDSVGTALFPEVSSMPRLTARMYSSQGLQRVQRGQAGAQRFFTLNGRAFCLYSVVGDQREAARLTPTVNDVTRQIEVTAR